MGAKRPPAQFSERALYYHSLHTGSPYNALENIVVATHRQDKYYQKQPDLG
jgi:hypothetical protein